MNYAKVAKGGASAAPSAAASSASSSSVSPASASSAANSTAAKPSTAASSSSTNPKKPVPAKAATAAGTSSAPTASASTPATISYSSIAKKDPPKRKKKVSKHSKIGACQKETGYLVTVKAQLTEGGEVTQLRGIVYACHDGVLILQESSGLRLINVDCLRSPPARVGENKIISDHEVAEFPYTYEPGDPQREKFKLAYGKRETVLSNRNKDASADAQRLFDDLGKTFKCTWDGTTIVINDLGNLRIEDPYTPANVSGTEQRAVERVRSILEHMKRNEAQSP